MTSKPKLGLSPEDQIILVLGDTGVGKSSFIQALTGQAADVGVSLFSETKEVSFYSFKDSPTGRRVTLIDTPGFDDSEDRDVAHFATIASWLAAIYADSKIIPSSILYLDRIGNTRTGGTYALRLRLIEHILGVKAIARTIFVTTQWPPPNKALAWASALRREEALKSDSQLFQPFLKQGGRVMRYMGDTESARIILQETPHNPPANRTPLQIQKELVDDELGLKRTRAGQIIDAKARVFVAFYRATVAERERERKTLERSTDEKSVRRRAELENEIASYKKFLANTQRDQKILQSSVRRGLVEGFRRAIDLSRPA